MELPNLTSASVSAGYHPASLPASGYAQSRWPSSPPNTYSPLTTVDLLPTRLRARSSAPPLVSTPTPTPNPNPTRSRAPSSAPRLGSIRPSPMCSSSSAAPTGPVRYLVITPGYHPDPHPVVAH
eukprot:scaffold1596_cov25-Phaeocystis_antarctica.AAC.1